ncbi:MAG: twin-arginine translocation signal domain-containing protein [Ginsengibacter sp.]
MQQNDYNLTTDRRGFLGTLATGAGALSIASLSLPLRVAAESGKLSFPPDEDPDEWFNKITGKHRIVFDVTAPHEIFPFAWPRVFMITNAMTGTPEKSCNEVIILRHEAIPYALEDRLWAKYKLGEMFKITDPATSAPSVRNMFWKPKAGDFSVPGIGNVQIGINELQESGAMFCVCNMAITVFSAAIAQTSNMDAGEVKKDFISGVLPDIQVVPSGVWAVGRAQEHECAYCFVG